MAQLPSITTISSSPPADPELRNTVAALRATLRDGACLTEPLSVMTRGRLGMRLELLRGCAKQASVDQVEMEVAKLMTSYPSLRGSSEIDAKAMIFQYAEALAGAPLWAIRDACKAIARGAVPDINPDFAPSSARLRKLVDGYVSAVHLEARSIKELLEAPVVMPDNTEMAKRAAEVISSGFKKLGKMLDETINADRRPLAADGSEIVDAKAPSWEQIREVYKTRNLPGIVSRNVSRNVTSDDTVTVDDKYSDQAAGGR
ncbi:MAG: hypothetical protein JWQ94_555 [Tardiphaga sp.]|nr:hypothetical protein [Tardiphaga sp.]